MGDSEAVNFRRSVLEQGPADVTNPVVAWLRFWTQGWRFHGRASRSEFWWVIALELALAGVALWVVGAHGTGGRWELYVDPFGAVPSPQVSFDLVDRGRDGSFGWGAGNREVWPDGWDLVLLVPTILTIVPRWSLLVRRLHDRDHTGLWILLLVFTGPIGWLVVMGMAASRSRPGGARFDRGLFGGGRGLEATGRHMSSTTTGVA
ncbi:DUF805 domain-containing protein [Curtobacterium poinsettiae]|uniref:DUF805 domain-containing protein n=1 Tax=Curtobacterium poinsettiae TaxID=159612 RepID=UPI0021CA86A7|nr:DUF805 domain-containing protein [Curtobacterium flaccumfaciens]MCU0152174.1 DUF805 domain-containing protein [Curtobacterium flaccumfaciens pv. poinsettiae]UXN15844.1 DUF805 domain-containing protein [Curtobacterium flaccumfaciens pv. poinsettiae]